MSEPFCSFPTLLRPAIQENPGAARSPRALPAIHMRVAGLRAPRAPRQTTPPPYLVTSMVEQNHATSSSGLRSQLPATSMIMQLLEGTTSRRFGSSCHMAPTSHPWSSSRRPCGDGGGRQARGTSRGRGSAWSELDALRRPRHRHRHLLVPVPESIPRADHEAAHAKVDLAWQAEAHGHGRPTHHPARRAGASEAGHPVEVRKLAAPEVVPGEDHKLLLEGIHLVLRLQRRGVVAGEPRLDLAGAAHRKLLVDLEEASDALLRARRDVVALADHRRSLDIHKALEDRVDILVAVNGRCHHGVGLELRHRRNGRHGGGVGRVVPGGRGSRRGDAGGHALWGGVGARGGHPLGGHGARHARDVHGAAGLAAARGRRRGDAGGGGQGRLEGREDRAAAAGDGHGRSGDGRRGV
mmetsp:Transcript_4638/g.15349  ORF Transcript_4638/g.15349 Transcript_4638/m.15349 type:complete len:410 (+) Transcript_4638:345-1574(+)